MRRIRPLLPWLLLLALLALPATALAHANLVRSEPASGTRLDRPPPQVQAWFSETLEPQFSSLHVLDASGKAVDAGDSHVVPGDPTSMVVSVPPNLPNGSYTIAWQTLSTVDGHSVRGIVTFGVGAAAPLTEAPAPQEISLLVILEGIARAAQYLVQTLLLGGFLLAACVVPAAASGTFGAAFRPTARAGTILLLLVGLLSLLLQAVLVGGGSFDDVFSPALGSLAFGTRYGMLWLIRMGLALALALLVWGAPLRSPWLWTEVVLGAATLLVNSLNSHGAAVEALTTLAIGADWLHQAAVAGWLGGLFGLVVLLARTDWAGPGASRGAALGLLLPRFSVAALISVPLLVIAGTYLSLLQVGSWDALFGTDYGRLILLKIALVVLMVAIGVFHFLVVQPRLGRARGPAARSSPGGGPATLDVGLISRFRGSLRVEAAFGALALIAAGLLTSLQPAWQTWGEILASRPLVQQASAGGLDLTLTIAPGRPGPNTYTLAIADQSGRPPASVEKAVVRLTFLDQELGETEVPLTQQPDGTWSARGAQLGVAGRWQALLLVRRQGLDDARTAVRFALTPPGGQASQPQPLASLPAPDSRTGLAAAAVLAGIALAWYAWRTAGGELRRGAPGLAASLAVIAVGLFVGARSLSDAPPLDLANLRNPFPPDQQSLAIGKQVYDRRCATCHGEDGHGDGPQAAALRPPPADLRVHMAAGHTDAQLFNWITNGVPGTAMPAFGDQLTEEQRWHVINYIRTFALESASASPAADTGARAAVAPAGDPALAGGGRRGLSER